MAFDPALKPLLTQGFKAINMNEGRQFFFFPVMTSRLSEVSKLTSSIHVSRAPRKRWVTRRVSHHAPPCQPMLTKCLLVAH